ncbi:MAG: response regulator transcription factor [Arcobacter sp.]|jgi:DNA-binding response OmpR family regulator|uniref:response regulator transcription factor n=1 Tax=Arcobacter sp. TaxID=1872629 RepID=UPI002A748FA7|nr:response regulator transcription factor [Arcobacter sp.]MDY3200085.1 response regulator transcription factor [Arcobacter sp.]
MNNLNLLYVEDDEETVESIDFFLKRHFKEIYLAQDGEQALSFFEEKDPDIIILDINIPKLNGIKLATKIREKNKKVPIIFLTAYSDKDNLLQAIHLHAFSYLIKPFKINELIETIDKCKKELLCEHTNPNLRKLSENLIWNKLKKELYFNKEKVSLTKNELSLINLFVENDFKFFTPEEINEYIFLNHDLKNNSIIQLISRLKKKITEITSDSEFFIENIYNKGYRLK